MSVHELCGVARGVGRHGILPLFVKRAVGKRARDHVETELGQKRMIKRQKLVNVQPERNTDICLTVNDFAADKPT